MSLRHRDRITVAREIDDPEASDYETFEETEDGETVVYEEIEVFNWINVLQPAVLRGGNPVQERFQANIGAGDSDRTPDAITEWVAEELTMEYKPELEEQGIEVIDVEAEEVRVL